MHLKKVDQVLDRPGQADAIEITPEMIEAGFKVLCNSGLADDYLAADKHTVADIFRAMLSLRRGSLSPPLVTA